MLLLTKLVRTLTRPSSQVVATVRSLAKFPRALRDVGAQPLVLDLEASDEEIREVAQDALQIYGHVDVLVNNAGTNAFGYGPVEEIRYALPPGYNVATLRQLSPA